MDAFFASVEQRDNPEYRGKPVVVGGLSSRGVIAAASYEARKYGVYSAMPSKIARKKCTFLIFARPRFEAYKEVSKQIMQIFLEYTDLVEPLSLDEAFLDVTTHKKGKPSATLIAKEIKERIKNEVGLTASAGISLNKFLAKIASDYNKPNGLYLIKPEDAEGFVEELPIEKFFGIGKVTAKKMHSLKIFYGKDLKKISKLELIKKFGKQGAYYYDICRAIDNREVKPDRLRKSVGAEKTFETDLNNKKEIEEELIKIAEKLITRIEKVELYGKTITVKIKFHDFKVITRSKTIGFEIKSLKILKKLSLELFRNEKFENIKIRLIGISVSNFTIKNSNIPIQLTFDF